MTSDSARRWLILAAFLVALVPLKVADRPGQGPFRLDASYYFQIARHVAEGDGLLTSVSLYHEGLNPLPAPAAIYPLWPLLLGYVGRIAGLIEAANFLPPLFFFLDLILLYALAGRIAACVAPESRNGLLGTSRLPIDTGHVVVALFATNPMFWFVTSQPYTEGLAFALSFGTLLAIDSAARRGASFPAFFAGILGGLAFLARTQMILVPAGILLILAVLALRAPRVWRLAAGFAAGAVAAAAPWLAYRALRPAEITNIGSFVTWTPRGPLGHYLSDRLPGLWVAFDPWSPLSYFYSFGPAVALVPVALVWAAVNAVRHSKSLHRDLELSHLTAAAAIVIGLMNHAILNDRHAQFFLPWLFGWRHGLLLIFPLTVAAIYVTTRDSRVIRSVVMLLLAATLIAGALRVQQQFGVHHTILRNESDFITWLQGQDPTPTMLTVRAQRLGMLTRGRYHWISCNEPPEQTKRMLERLPIDYVIVYDAERPCRFLRGLGPLLEVAGSFGTPPEQRIWVLRERAPTVLDPIESD